ncbi:MAG: hypothetical protein ACREMQ_11150 [Longimicrobiales bacterium]
MQQKLDYLDVPAPDPPVWSRVDDERRAIVIDLIARLIGKAARAHAQSNRERQELTHD